MRLSCRKYTISDELSAVRTLEVAGFRLREEIEAVSEGAFPPDFPLLVIPKIHLFYVADAMPVMVVVRVVVTWNPAVIAPADGRTDVGTL